MSPESEAVLATLSDHTKLVVDILKHLTTLATGSILLIATFIDKVKPATHYKAVLSFSIGLLLLAVLCATNACIQLTTNYTYAIKLRSAVAQKSENLETAISELAKPFVKREERARAAAWIASTSFGLAIILIGIYIIGNLR